MKQVRFDETPSYYPQEGSRDTPSPDIRSDAATGSPDTPLPDTLSDIATPPTSLTRPSLEILNVTNTAKEAVWQLLAAILTHKAAYKTLLDAKGNKAQATLDILHKVLDSQDVPKKLAHAVLYATMRLCTASGAYPQCFALQGIRYEAKPVASGAFGDIWKGYYGNHPVCLKVARVYQGSNVEHLIRTYMREAIMWSHLSHSNVLPFYGIYEVDERLGCVCLVSPWMQNGNINEYLETHPEAPRLPLVHGILAGLGYLHRQSVVHGDLKGANILISRTGSACLADFGLSSLIDAEILRWTSLKTITQVGGTVRWQAPELMEGPESGSLPTRQADVYSIASVMYEVFTGTLPYHELRNDTTVMLRVMRGDRPTPPPQNQTSELSAVIWGVMENCWNHDPEKRPSVEQVAETLTQAVPTELTLTRLYIQQLERGLDMEVEAPTALSFRAAMRGRSANFSVGEVDLLRGYTESLSQDALGASMALLPSIDEEADARNLTAATQIKAGADPEEHSIPPGAEDPVPTNGFGGSLPYLKLRDFRPPNWSTGEGRLPLSGAQLNPPWKAEREKFDRMPRWIAGPHCQLWPRADSLPVEAHRPARIHLEWDMLMDSGPTYRDPMPWPARRNEPATFPRLSEIRIVSEHFPWLINLKAQAPDIGVTCDEVIKAIASSMNKLISKTDFDLLSPAQQKTASEAYRLNRSSGLSVLGLKMGEGMKRVDFLGYMTLFGGMEVDDIAVERICKVSMPGYVVLRCQRRASTTSEERGR